MAGVIGGGRVLPPEWDRYGPGVVDAAAVRGGLLAVAVGVVLLAEVSDPGAVADVVLLAAAVVVLGVWARWPRLPTPVLTLGVLVPVVLAARSGQLEPALFLVSLVSAVVATPNLVWQAAHGWPMVQVAGAISDGEGGPAAAALFLPMQVLTMNPLLAPVWIAGLWWLWRSPGFRPLALIYALLLVLLAAIGGRSYDLLPMYLPLFAAGAVVLERRLARRLERRSTGLRPWAAPGAVVAAALLVVPAALPVLPVTVHRHLPFAGINPVLGDAIGWPQLVRDVAAVRDGLPVAERATAVVLTANYGEAGAVELLGAHYGLGQPVSGHNQYWDWGPPHEDTSTVIALGFRSRIELDRRFRDVQQAGTADNGVGVDNEEQGAPLWVCRTPVAPWPHLWAAFRHYEA